MATTKVSALSALTTTDGNEELLINDGGTSKKVTIDNVLHDSSIRSEHYADGSIDNEHIADDAINSEHYADGSIDNAHIADDAIDSEHYADASIDFAHVQNVAANSVLGRNANSSGVLSEVALATTQLLIGDGTGFTTAALSGDVTMTNAGVVTIGNDKIDSQHYADGSIDNAHIADDAIDSEHYADGSIDNAHIADDAIDSEHYADGSIDTAHIGDLQVTTAKIAADAITAAKIADDVVTSDHLADDSVGADQIADNAVGLAAMASGTDGNIISYDASGNPVAIATGNDGQVLTSAGAGAQPAFEDAGGGDVVDDTSPQLGGDLDCNGAQIQWSKGADVASATALPLLTDGNYFDVTGTATVTSFNATGGTGTQIKLHFDGACTLTHNADIILPGAANIVTTAGDEAEFIQLTADAYRCTNYTKVSGRSVIGAIEKVSRAYHSSVRAAFSDGRDLFANNVGFVGWNVQFAFTKEKADTDLLVVFAMSVCNFNDCYLTAIYTGTNTNASNLHRFAFAGKNAIGDTDPLDGMIVTGQIVLTGIAAGVNNWQWAMGRDNDGYNSQYTLNPDTNDGAQYLGATESTIMVYEGDFYVP